MFESWKYCLNAPYLLQSWRRYKTPKSDSGIPKISLLSCDSSSVLRKDLYSLNFKFFMHFNTFLLLLLLLYVCMMFPRERWKLGCGEVRWCIGMLSPRKRAQWLEKQLRVRVWTLMLTRSMNASIMKKWCQPLATMIASADGVKAERGGAKKWEKPAVQIVLRFLIRDWIIFME